MGARDELTFDAERHEYRFGGAVVPSVTQVLKPLYDFARIPPDVLEAKADLGTRVHEACHYLDDDDLDEETIEADVEPYLAAWRSFKSECRVKVLASEQRVHDTTFGYAGTLDRVLTLAGGEPWLVDIKTALTVPMAAGPQTAAYLRALGLHSVRQRAAVRLRPDGTYRFDPLHDPDDWSAFMAALTLHRFKEKHA